MARFRPKRPERRPIVIGQDRETSLHRLPPTLDGRQTIACGTNGKETERQYLNALKAEPWVSNAAKLQVKFFAGSPVDVIKGLGRLKSDEDFDSAWAVCDVDEYECSPAAEEADLRGVRLIWSNPCFEVWLVLHLKQFTRFLENADKAGTELGRALGKQWRKASVDFGDFRDGVIPAMHRAQDLEAPPLGNPSTDMWKLIDHLQKLSA